MPRAPLDLRERAIRALARAEKTRQELRETLLRHAEPGPVDALLEDLAGSGLQSDTRAAQIRARNARHKGHARARAEADLLAAGIPASVVTAALEEAYANAQERTELQQLAARLLPTGSPLKQRQKVARQLLRMGFDGQDVAHACALDEDSSTASPEDA